MPVFPNSLWPDGFSMYKGYLPESEGFELVI